MVSRDETVFHISTVREVNPFIIQMNNGFHTDKRMTDTYKKTDYNTYKYLLPNTEKRILQ